jgi:methylenetetrahydrofolate dehydrogenase (NADP+) / methenyltetrahydrofolate cyclohydrolase / formyltetrahydrofolate synthetase
VLTCYFYREIQLKLRADVEGLKIENPDFHPGLAIVQVGGREDSNVYIRMKIKAAAEIGIKAEHVKLPQTITEYEVRIMTIEDNIFIESFPFQLLKKIDNLNNDPNVHGIIVQMPLDSVNKIDSNLITDAVIPEKDVDGYLNSLHL